MSPKIDTDPELVRQQLAASSAKVKSIQDRLSTETDQSLRYFGTRRAMAGVKSSPLVATK